MNISGIFNKSNFNAFFKTARETNLSTLIYRSASIIEDALLYPGWFRKQIPSQETLDRQRNHIFEYTPCISIVVPTYCTPIPFLREMIQSVRSQTYTNWELCIADASPSDSEVRTVLLEYKKKDRRIKIKFLESNEGISGNTNHALSLATGDYIGLLDHDDMLAPNALFEIASAVNQDTTIDVLYTDEDKVDGNGATHYYPNFKPDYNQQLLRSCNYICHFFVFSKEIYSRVGVFDSDYDGSQDYDYILRATKAAKNIHHIPMMLYHWRVHQGSVAGDPAQKNYCYATAVKTLQNNLDSRSIKGTVNYSRLIGFYDTDYAYEDSVLILHANKDFHLDCSNSAGITGKYCENLKDILNNAQDSNAGICIILDKDILQLNQKAISQSISYFADHAVGAVTFKNLHKTSVISIGCCYRDGRIVGCHQNVPFEDAGYYGRALLDQYVPLCNTNGFVCKREDLTMYLETIQQNHSEDIHTFADFTLLYSLYLHKMNKYIIGSPRAVIYSTQNKLSTVSQILLESKKEELQKASRLYAAPPYIR